MKLYWHLEVGDKLQKGDEFIPIRRGSDMAGTGVYADNLGAWQEVNSSWYNYILDPYIMNSCMIRRPVDENNTILMNCVDIIDKTIHRKITV